VTEPTDSGLVRITVVSDHRRVDLAVPSFLPVAELLPGLARCLGVLDRATTYDGYRVVTPDGRALRLDEGLAAQGVDDGGIVAISARVDDEHAALYDDLPEAVARIVTEVTPGDRVVGRCARRGPAAVLLLAGAPAVPAAHGAGAALSGFVVAGVLIAVAGWFSRARGDHADAAGVAYLGCLYAVLAGLASAWHGSLTGSVVIAAGGGLLGTSVLAFLAMARSRLLMVPAVVCGGVLLVAGLVGSANAVDVRQVLTGLLVVTVLAGGGLPGLVVGTGRVGRHAWRGGADADVVSAGIDLVRLRADVASARKVLVVLSTTAGLLLVLLAPVAVSLEPAGWAVPVLGSVLVMLRTRRCHAAVDVLIGVGSGALGLAATAISVLWLEDAWSLTGVMTVAAVGVVLLATRQRRDHVRIGRLGDVVERAAVGALAPAFLVATGFSFDRP
jgi:type VII secretion integral membrane protein EccD